MKHSAKNNFFAPTALEHVKIPFPELFTFDCFCVPNPLETRVGSLTATRVAVKYARVYGASARALRTHPK